MVVPHTDIDLAVGEATATMRRVKKLKASEVNNFEISRSDNLANMLFENLRYVRYAATIIGFITLLGAAIGLMNIILVSVTERTKEIGIRKAMGATPKVIKMQFLLESVFIGQLGGAIGIILGILIGNLVAIFTGTGFFVPWLWISFGVFLCFVVSILAALVPAMKAAKLDPIIALHYE
jgi:putative ABC transport system permease protein